MHQETQKMTELGVPDFPLFKNMVENAANQNGIAIDDIRMQKSFTYLELIYATSKLRLELLKGKR